MLLYKYKIKFLRQSQWLDPKSEHNDPPVHALVLWRCWSSYPSTYLSTKTLRNLIKYAAQGLPSFFILHPSLTSPWVLLIPPQKASSGPPACTSAATLHQGLCCPPGPLQWLPNWSSPPIPGLFWGETWGSSASGSSNASHLSQCNYYLEVTLPIFYTLSFFILFFSVLHSSISLAMTNFSQNDKEFSIYF